MRRVLKLLFLLAFVAFFKESALAQRSGSGQFAGPNLCADVTGQIAGSTYCFDQTSGSLNVWTGSNYIQISGSSDVGYFIPPWGLSINPTANSAHAGIVAVGTGIPNDSNASSAIYTYGVYSPKQAYLVFDAGMYPSTAGAWKVTDPNGHIFHVLENAGEYGWFMDSGNTVGSQWSGARTQYMALRDASTASGAGVWLEDGGFNAINGGVSAQAIDVGANPVSTVLTGAMTSFGNGNVTFTFSGTNYYTCVQTYDSRAANGHAVADCSFVISWNGSTGTRSGNVVNIGYLPWLKASSQAGYSWWGVQAVTGVNIPTGCWVDGGQNPGQGWVTLSYHGPSAVCGQGAWIPDTSVADVGSVTMHGTYLTN